MKIIKIPFSDWRIILNPDKHSSVTEKLWKRNGYPRPLGYSFYYPSAFLWLCHLYYDVIIQTLVEDE